MKTTFFLFAILASFFTLSSCAESQQVTANLLPSKLSIATFAGGCFWCVESDFEKLPGVHQVISGFSGGNIANPSYQQVSSGNTGHVEAVQVYYDPKIIQYTDLLQAFWRQIDPTDNSGQFVDRGQQYRPIIFYNTNEQQKQAEASKQKLQASQRFDKPLTVEIKAFNNFYPAENYHQDYYKKNPIRYKFYRYNSGRDQYLTKVWGKELKITVKNKQKYSKPSEKTLHNKLSTLQYQVTQQNATEPAFKNAFWDNKKAGIYVDIASGEPLFSSTDKFKSGTGWPSFSQPLVATNIIEKKDYYLLYPRTEIRSKYADSHLGHVFKDGPQPTGLRYCINSAALRFIAVENLQSSGYGDYLKYFKQQP